VRTYAELLGNKRIARTLQRTLDEEGQTDKTLTKLARTINVEAESAPHENDKKSRRTKSLAKKVLDAVGL
jgi:ferritin-like metal-binding protein YciE